MDLEAETSTEVLGAGCITVEAAAGGAVAAPPNSHLGHAGHVGHVGQLQLGQFTVGATAAEVTGAGVDIVYILPFKKNQQSEIVN